MPIRSPRIDPDGTHPSPYRGCVWVTSHFPGQRMLLVHGAEGQLLGEFRVSDRLATEEFEQMMIDWLEREADPLPVGAAHAHLKLA